jgi:hypothetical protein
MDLLFSAVGLMVFIGMICAVRVAFLELRGRR